MAPGSYKAPSFVTVFLFPKGSVRALNYYLIIVTIIFKNYLFNINTVIVKLKSYFGNCVDNFMNGADGTLELDNWFQR